MSPGEVHVNHKSSVTAADIQSMTRGQVRSSASEEVNHCASQGSIASSGNWTHAPRNQEIL